MPCNWCGTTVGVKPVKVNGIVKTVLCFRCFGFYAESGQRPASYRMSPQALAGWRKLDRLVRNQ